MNQTPGNSGKASMQHKGKHNLTPVTTASTGTPAGPHQPGAAHLDSLQLAMTAVGFMIIGSIVLWAVVCRCYWWVGERNRRKAVQHG
jgi:hypothetical protein